MTNLVWLSMNPDTPASGYWDQCLLFSLLKDSYVTYDIGRVPGIDEAVVVIPGAYQGKYIDGINGELAKLKRCKVIITSDEENNFPIDELSHPNMEVYANYMTDKYEREVKWLPIGPARLPQVEYEPKTIDWFFAGQVNHDSRRKLIEVLEPLHNGDLLATDGFAQGVTHAEYYQRMAKAKAVPAPRGNISPDSFRFYEALELGAIPIPENKEWWTKLFPDLPMEVANTWDDAPRLINKAVTDQEYRNKCVAWWQRKKLDIKDELTENEYPTVVVPVSPIKSHPKTTIIDETIASIRHQLPSSRIIVTFDGVRTEQSARYLDYQEFIERFLRKYNNQNVYPMIFDKHTHQVGMMREAIKHCTEHIVYVEQDTPFTDDPIDWNGCIKSLKRTDLIRFHFEAFIPEPHEYLMMGMINRSPVPLLMTKQYSQRPHLTTKKFYEKLMSNFSPDAVTFFEDLLHSTCQQNPKEYRLAIYHPKGSIKRSYHLDGREGEEKYDDQLVF